MAGVGRNMRWGSGLLVAFWLLLALAPLFRLCCHDLIAAGHDPAAILHAHAGHHAGEAGSPASDPHADRFCDHDGFQPGQLHALPVTRASGELDASPIPLAPEPALPVSVTRLDTPPRQGAPPGRGASLYLRTQRLRI